MATGDNRFSTAEEVIAELNSGYGESQNGPIKEINELTLESVETNAPRHFVKAGITVGAFRQDPYGNMSSSQRKFEVPLEVVGRLAETAPRFRTSFSKIFTELSAQLQQDHTAWYDAGLPTQEATPLMKPLRWKPAVGR